MKQVWITLKGTGQIYWMENFTEEPTDWDMPPMNDFSQMEEDGWLDCGLCEIAFLMELEGVFVGNEAYECNEDIIKKKGKYINRDDILKADYDLVAPFYVLPFDDEAYIENTFCIELEDDEEFDPKKLQLIKSDYEVDFIPYGIVSDKIMYDGKEIEMYEYPEYRTVGGYDAFVCMRFCK